MLWVCTVMLIILYISLLYFIYLNKFNIIIPRYMYTQTSNGYYLYLWRFINVPVVIIIIWGLVFKLLLWPCTL